MMLYDRRYSLLLITLWLALLPHYGHAAPAAKLTFPSPEFNVGTSSDFTWERQSGASGYWLSVKDDAGKQYGDRRVYSATTGNVRINDLPAKPLDVQLITIYPAGNTSNWDARTNYRLNAPASSIKYPYKPTLSGATQWIVWEKIEGASFYYLSVSDSNGQIVISKNMGLSDRTKVTGLPTDGRTMKIKLHTVIGNNWDRVTSKTFKSASSTVVASGSLTAGFDWSVPAGYSSNGGLVDKQWNRDTSTQPVRPNYINTITYDLRWKDAYAGLIGQGNPFAAFENFLNKYADGRNVLVRLESTSRCNLPGALVNQFNYYGGTSIAFWEPAYLTELNRLVSQFGQRYANDPRVIGVHVGIADGEYKDGNTVLYSCPKDEYTNREGWGEMNMDEDELKSARAKGFNPDNFYSSVRSIIDIYANAFLGNEKKLAFMNFSGFIYDDLEKDTVPTSIIEKFNEKHPQLSSYALNRGLGHRDGLIENWMGYTEEIFGMTFTPANDNRNSCNMVMDESVADRIQGRYWGTENEEYGPSNFVIQRYGPKAEQPYRFMISSLRALQMRRNYVTIESDGMDINGATAYNTAGFLDYFARTVGRTKSDTPDAFVVHGERYIRQDNLSDYNVPSCIFNNHARIREFGRWLTEIEGGGYPSMAVDLTQNNYLFSMSFGLPAYTGSYPQSLQGGNRYEYKARYHNRFTYDINDQVVSNRCNSNCKAEVKVVFNDIEATTITVENQQGVLSSVRTTGQGGIKTATFPVNAKFNNAFRGGDFSVRSSTNIPVMLTRVNFVNP